MPYVSSANQEQFATSFVPSVTRLLTVQADYDAQTLSTISPNNVSGFYGFTDSADSLVTITQNNLYIAVYYLQLRTILWYF